MAKRNGNQLLIPVAIGSLALGAFLAVKFDIEDWFQGKKKRGKRGMMNKIKGRDETYIVSDGENIKNIANKPLNYKQKLKDAKQQRVVYGDNSSGIGTTFAGYVNSINPYGAGPVRELPGLPSFSDQSKVNTFGNSINLY